MKNKAYKSIWSNYRYVYSNLWEYDKKLVFMGILEILFSVLVPLGAVIIPSVVVGLLEQGASVLTFIKTLSMVFMAYGIVAGIQTFLAARGTMQYIDIRMNRYFGEFYSKSLNMDYHIIEDEDTRQKQEKAMYGIFSNGRGVEGFLHKNIILATSILGLIIYASIISSVHPLIVVLLLTISVIQFLVFSKAKNYEHKNKDVKSKIEVTQRYLEEQSFDLKAGKDIRLYQLDKWIQRVYNKANKEIKRLWAKERGVYYINDVVGVVLQFVRDALCYGYLIYMLMNGLNASYFVLYLGIISGFSSWFTKISEIISEITRDHLTICDYRQYMETSDVFKHSEGVELDSEGMALDIVFDHVTFRYPGSDRKILDDISFHMKKGDKFALVGINGAGKTTIVKLMCGFYQPTEGRILINGIDTRELNIDKYFEQIAVVFQDAFTMSFSIAENISGLNSDTLDRDKIKNVLQKAGLMEKISKLEKGIDTYLNKDMDENGIQLSGGEVQKLMLARALYKEAKLLILDEPTAALDAIAESEMYEKYQSLLKGKTSLFISHRLASTRFCNHILFMENGKIKEEGTHDELLTLDRSYAEMFKVQSQYYKDGGDNNESQESIA